MQTEQYIWHETIQTQHTRRSHLSEVAPDVIAHLQRGLAHDSIPLPDGYRCEIVYRSAHCLEARVLTADNVPLVHFGVASRPRCGQPLWERLGGAPDARPREPWCAASLDAHGAAADPQAYTWIADFERCLAWAWLTMEDRS